MFSVYTEPLYTDIVFHQSGKSVRIGDKQVDVHEDTEMVEYIGPRGSRGDQGDQGIQGVKGVKGAMGAKGDVGDKGARGDQGSTGIKGVAGVKGVKGEGGPTGDVGATGAKGDKGGKRGQGRPWPSGGVQPGRAVHGRVFDIRRCACVHRQQVFDRFEFHEKKKQHACDPYGIVYALKQLRPGRGEQHDGSAGNIPNTCPGGRCRNGIPRAGECRARVDHSVGGSKRLINVYTKGCL